MAVTTGATYDQALATATAAVDTMLDRHSPEYVVGYLTSFIASRGLADDLPTPPAPTPAEAKVNDLMDALAASVEQAKASRRAYDARPQERCWRCANRIGGCMTEGCPGPQLARLDREGEWT